ncbi:site-2 protease family protein [Sneathiella sp. P13V-1]|uniref:site-2 protease family protein n=1 Tax=Sneathiella sp. P13V-1 TaxID=2697366 RepID=UPI00187BB41C|nr:site-2 protease family protein [Sneathiella sp. P13V-1]MBE7637686.1 site-2 protease family protein [Sneathiella sp. P13V-1]
MEILYTASTWVIPALLGITLHEAGHAYAAWKLGDPTAKSLGRVTLNPIKHIDPMGTIFIPGALLLIGAPFLFGYAKPVPVNFGRLHQPRRDMVWVALAGPAMNFLLAFLFALSMHIIPLLPFEVGQWAIECFYKGILLNVVLGVFNLLPIPPLDGGRIAVGILPNALALPLARLEKYGFLILIAAIFLIPMIGRQLGYNVSIMDWLFEGPISSVVSFIAKMAGLN